VIDELKAQIERTFGQKVTNRRQAELLSQDIYLKTKQLVSYNTIRRFFGLVAFTKPRQSTLDYLAQYCSFSSYLEFCRQFPSLDSWPKWESLFLSLNAFSIDDLLIQLKKRKNEHQDFALSFSIAAKELLVQERVADLVRLFQEPEFQFLNLNFDDVSQIGVILGLHFRNNTNIETEKLLLQQVNFRDLVVKSNVDYTQFNSKYGAWIQYIASLKGIDQETKQFVNSIRPFMFLLNEESIPTGVMNKIEDLTEKQHPILFGRIFCLKMILAKDQRERLKYVALMKKRLNKEPHFQAELLYVPAIQSILTKNPCLSDFTYSHLQRQPIAQHWYQISLISIQQIFIAARLIEKKEYYLAQSLIAHNPIDQIRFGYKEIMDLFITFFKIKIAVHFNEDIAVLEARFNCLLQRINLPLLSKPYFERYFEV
jgi:hypothetical protein